jgi:hypothetical protein
MKILLALLIAAAAATQAPVKAEDAAKHKVRADFTYKAKAGDAVLLVSDEIEGGDFPQAKVYVKAKGKLYGLGAYRRVDKVKWSADGGTVTFEGAQLREYGVDDVFQVQYKAGAKAVQKKKTGEAKDEPTG